MPAWVNAFDRKPVLYGKYHVKLNGNKEVITFFEFDRMMERYDSVEWLDETIESKPANIPVTEIRKVSLIEAIANGSLGEKHYQQLSNFIGVKKAERIKNKIEKL